MSNEADIEVAGSCHCASGPADGSVESHAGDVPADGDSACQAVGRTYRFEKPKRVREFTLQGRKTVTKQDLTGSQTLVYFGYGRCEVVCPPVIAVLKQAGIKVLFVSIDPDETADTAASIPADFMVAWGDSKLLMRSLGLSEYHNYPMSKHPQNVYLLDADVQWVGVATSPVSVESIFGMVQ